MFKAEFKIEGLEEIKKWFSKDLMRKTLRSTLDKSMTEIKGEIGNEVAEVYEIKPQDVKAKIEVKRTTQTELEATLNIHGEKPSLVTNFKGRQTPKGVIANVRKGSVSFYPHAFIVDKWHKAMIRTGRKRLPIQHRAGPSVTEMVSRPSIMSKIEAKASEIINKKFSEEVDKRMGGGR
jgi:hypothetical protein